MSERKPQLSQRAYLSLIILVGSCAGCLVIALFFFAIPRMKHLNTVRVYQHNQPVLTAKRANDTAGALDQDRQFDFYTLLSRPIEDDQSSSSDLLAPHVEIGETDQSRYLLQVASLATKQDAQRLASQLMLLGYDSFIQSHLGHSVRYYRVIVGPFDTLSLAEKERHQLQSRFSETFVIKS